MATIVDGPYWSLHYGWQLYVLHETLKMLRPQWIGSMCRLCHERRSASRWPHLAGFDSAAFAEPDSGRAIAVGFVDFVPLLIVRRHVACSADIVAIRRS